MSKKQNSPKGNFAYQPELEMKERMEVQKKTGRSNRRKQSEGSRMYQVVSQKNMRGAFVKVRDNKGSWWIDWVEVKDLLAHLQQSREETKRKLLAGNYKAKPVRSADIPKSNGKIRELWIPTVVDRVIQQGIVQVLSPHAEEIFHENSFWFRPWRSAHDAIRKAKQCIEQGNERVVEIDIEKFFDNVNHMQLLNFVDKLTGNDREIRRAVQTFLKAWISRWWEIYQRGKGTPQGWPLSPLLANLVLHELDKELEKRWHKFVRYADDVRIYLKSERAGERVLKWISQRLERKLKLKANEEKSKVEKVRENEFLGFQFFTKPEDKRQVTIWKTTKKKIKKNIRNFTKKWGSVEMKIEKINSYLQGVMRYYGLGRIKYFLQQMMKYVRWRLRNLVRRYRKKTSARAKNLRKLWLSRSQSRAQANTRKGPARVAMSFILCTTLTNERFAKQGLKNFPEKRTKLHYAR